MSERQKYILLLFLFFLASFGVTPQQNQLFIGDIDYESPDYILMFADHLYQTGDYKRAVIEYQRYLSTTGSIGLKNCGFKLADSYRKSGDLEHSLAIFEKEHGKGSIRAAKVLHSLDIAKRSLGDLEAPKMRTVAIAPGASPRCSACKMSVKGFAILRL